MKTGLMPIIRAMTQWISDWHDPLDPISDEKAFIYAEARMILDRLMKLREHVQKHQMGVRIE